MLAGCVGVEVEVEFVRMYRGQPLLVDVCEFPADQGLEFVDFVSLHRWGRYGFDGSGQAVFGDALLLRAPEEFARTAITPHDRMRYLGVCLLYIRFELIHRLLDLWAGPVLPVQVAEALASLASRFERAQGLTSLSQRAARYRLGEEFDLHLLY